MTSLFLAAEEADHGGVTVHPWLVALVTFGIFLGLLGLVWSFRHTVAPKSRRTASGATAGHGVTDDPNAVMHEQPYTPEDTNEGRVQKNNGPDYLASN